MFRMCFLAKTPLLQTNPYAVHCTTGNLLQVCKDGRIKQGVEQMTGMLTPEEKRQQAIPDMQKDKVMYGTMQHTSNT